MKSVLRSTLVGLAFLALVSAAGAQDTTDEGLPDGLKGFSGQVRGVVTAKGDANTIQFKVARLLRTWKGSTAENPKLILGRAVTVGPRWVKNEEGGEWHPQEIHVAFIQKLVVGQELTLEIRNVEGDNFIILELNKEQRAIANGTAETDVSPEKLKARVQELEKQVEKLKAENDELRKKLQVLRR